MTFASKITRFEDLQWTRPHEAKKMFLCTWAVHNSQSSGKKNVVMKTLQECPAPTTIKARKWTFPKQSAIPAHLMDISSCTPTWQCLKTFQVHGAPPDPALYKTARNPWLLVVYVVLCFVLPFHCQLCPHLSKRWNQHETRRQRVLHKLLGNQKTYTVEY